MFSLRKRNYFLLLGVVLILCCLLMAGCGKPSEGENGEGKQNVGSTEKIIRGSLSDVPNIDPGVGSDYGSTTALINIYDTLVFPQADGTISPLLATDWQTSSDGLKWTFKIRPGVKFHNGDEVTAEDVAFSMQRLLTMGEGYAFLFTDVVKEAKATDNNTVEFYLKKPFGPFLATIMRLYVLNKDLVMANIKPGPYGEMGDYGKEWLITNDAGSGPYVVKELKKQEYLYAVKFPEYWGGWDKDAPDAIKLIGTTEPATIKTLMARRELELTDQWQTEESLKALDRIPGVAVNSAFSGCMFNIMFNTKKAPTDDVHFRKALSYAFDYKTVVEKLFPGQRQSRGPVPAHIPGHNPDILQYNRDLEKAKEELAKSKYADKLDQYPVEFVWISEVPDEEKVALLFQANAEELGIKVDIVRTPWLSYIDQVANPETTPNASVVIHDLQYNEAGAMLEMRYHSKTTGTFQQAEWLQDPKLDAALDDAVCTMDQTERFNKYKKIQERIVDLAPTIWVYDQAEKRAYQEDYMVWPAAELTKAGKPVCPVMGYNFYFHDFKIFPEKKPQ